LAKGKKLNEPTFTVYFLGLTSELIMKNLKSVEKLNLYLNIVSNFLTSIFELQGQRGEMLREKSMGVLQKNGNLEEIVNKMIESNESIDHVKLLKFIIFAKNEESIKEKLSQKSMENLLNSLISENQAIRKEALRAFLFMLEVSPVYELFRKS
jgi:hypothetical protein